MGIIKKILLVILLFSVCFISAQTTGDTLIVKGTSYIRHIVKPNESYNTISRKYNVSIQELKLHNKNSKLFYNQSLLIPIKLTLAERLLFKNKRTNRSVFLNSKKGKEYKKFSKNDTLNIAVLLPFYTTKNQGQGIGLSLSKNIIEQHGGRLTLVNNIDKHGATAKIYLSQNNTEKTS